MQKGNQLIPADNMAEGSFNSFFKVLNLFHTASLETGT